MPELPEVETVKLQLEQFHRKKTDRKILKIIAGKHFSSLLKIQEFELQQLSGQSIAGFKRYGKYLIFEFAGLKLVSHFGMSGSWRVQDSGSVTDVPHTHLQIVFSDQVWSYVDPRRFGHVYLLKQNSQHPKALFLAQMVDLTHPDFTPQFVLKQLQRFPERCLKVALLDQALFAGSGNYIASEVCARAGLLPTRLCGVLGLREAKKIHYGFESVLKGAIERQGTTFAGGYADTSGERGEGVSNLVVFYQKICGLCEKTKVEKIQLAGRGTYFCPKCQK